MLRKWSPIVVVVLLVLSVVGGSFYKKKYLSNPKTIPHEEEVASGPIIEDPVLHELGLHNIPFIRDEKLWYQYGFGFSQAQATHIPYTFGRRFSISHDYETNTIATLEQSTPYLTNKNEWVAKQGVFVTNLISGDTKLIFEQEIDVSKNNFGYKGAPQVVQTKILQGGKSVLISTMEEVYQYDLVSDKLSKLFLITQEDKKNGGGYYRPRSSPNGSYILFDRLYDEGSSNKIYDIVRKKLVSLPYQQYAGGESVYDWASNDSFVMMRCSYNEDKFECHKYLVRYPSLEEKEISQNIANVFHRNNTTFMLLYNENGDEKTRLVKYLPETEEMETIYTFDTSDIRELVYFKEKNAILIQLHVDLKVLIKNESTGKFEMHTLLDNAASASDEPHL